MKKNYGHIDKYKTYKKLYKLSKPKSPIIIEFITNDLPDEWLIDIIEYKNKTGLITLDFMILQKELNKWLNRYKDNGFILTNT
jgi:hypothetical protein